MNTNGRRKGWQRPVKNPHPVLDRVRERIGVGDAEIGRRIGTSRRYIAMCRRGGAVPYGLVVTAYRAGQLPGLDLHWVFTGERIER